MKHKLFFVVLVMMFITGNISCTIDLYLKHFDRQTKELKVSDRWRLQESGIFNPRFEHVDPGDPDSALVYDYVNVSPMIKITGTDIELQGNKHTITNGDMNHGGQVAIEIGYTPNELAADPTLKQPHSIKIKDLRLIDFDCGIIIHHGVNDVVIENCLISGCSIGILTLGKTGSVLANSVLDIKLDKVSVIGHASNRHESLVAFKALVETTYGYPVDLFMKLSTDPLNSDAVDVYTYAGIWLICSENIEMKNVKVHHIGYCDFAITSEGNGKRTHAVGIVVKNCKRLNLKDISSDDSFSELQSAGMRLDNVVRMRVNHSIFSNHIGGIRATGVEVINNDSLDYSIDEVWFDTVSCEDIVGGEVAVGLNLSDSRGFAGSNLVCKFNKGGKESYGIYTNKAHTLTLEDSTLSSMLTTHAVNDVATEKGVIAAGLYGQNVVGCQIKKSSCVSMKALNTAYGMYFKDSSDIRIQKSQFSANISLSPRSGEAAAIRAEQDVEEISRYAPVVAATNTGSYGILFDVCQRLKIEECLSVSNYGTRAAGFSFKNCRSVGLMDSIASAQVAIGLMLDTSFMIDHIADPTNATIQPAHMPLLFSDMTKTSVDLVATTDLFLEKMTEIRTRQSQGLEPLYDDVITALATKNLLQAIVARYRLWGTAFGIHTHNTVGCLFQRNICLGQLSLFDGAAGICFSGRNSGHLIEDCNTSYNIAWYLSAQALPTSGAPQYASKYDLSGMKVFWETLTNPWTIHRSLASSYDVHTVAWSPNGTMLATGDSNNEVKIWDVKTATVTQTLTGHTGTINALAWSPDGTKLASGATGILNNIKIWNTSTWVADQTVTHGLVGVKALAFKPDNSQLVSGAIGILNNIKVWNTSTWVVDQTLTHGLVGVNSVSWKSDGSQVASASADSSNNIKIWNSSTWIADQTLNSHTAAVNCVAWNHDDSLLASGSDDDTVKIWNTSTWAVDQTLSDHTGDVTAVVFKENGKKLASASKDLSIKVWDTTSWGTAEKSLAVHTESVNGLAWKPDGILLASASADDTVKIQYADTWNVAATDNDIGIYNPSMYLIAQGQKLFGDGTLGNDISIRLKGANDRTIVSPIGPNGAGMILGDFMIDAYVKNNKIQFNVGNSGYGHGVILNQSYYSVLENNLIEGSQSSVYGFGSGILDVTAHAVNTYMKNVLESNKVSTYSNANYVVPFNPADTNSLAFPVTKMFNGNFSQPTTDLDNVVIEYSQNAESYGVESLVNLPLHPDLKAELTSHNCWN